VTELIEGSEIEDHTAAIASRLKALTAVAEEIGADRIDRDASDLDERLAQGRFFVRASVSSSVANPRSSTPAHGRKYEEVLVRQDVVFSRQPETRLFELR